MSKFLMKQTEQLMSFLVSKKTLEVMAAVQPFLSMGKPNFMQLMTIPTANRIVALCQQDFTRCFKAINAAVFMFMRSGGMDADTALQITNTIINEAQEDNLSIEDVIIFMMKLNGGQYGQFYGKGISPSAFMEKFEIYRQARYETVINYRYEQSAQHKVEGPSERSSDDTTTEIQIHEIMKDEFIAHLKRENNEQ